MHARGQLFKQTQGVLYAWNARENKLVDSSSVIPSLYRAMMMTPTMKSAPGGEKKYIKLSHPRSRINNLFTLKIQVRSLCKQTCYAILPFRACLNYAVSRRKSIGGKNKRRRRREGKICKSARARELRPWVKIRQRENQKCAARLVNLSPGTRFPLVPAPPPTGQRLIYTEPERYGTRYLWCLFVCAWKIIKNMAGQGFEKKKNGARGKNCEGRERKMGWDGIKI